MTDLNINTDDVKTNLVSFIQQTTKQAGFTKAVVGLSGGIDSALSCYLAVAALGAENVLGVRIPYKTSSEESLKDAQLVIDAVGIQSLTIPITEMVDPLISKFPDMSAIRKGNIMARTRMIVLFDQSASFDGLVVGTGNKTEILLGYTTLYGDSACSFNPVGDLYKTQVRQLAEALGIPEPIRTKSPSADLWQNQTDEGELGFTYSDVDRLLYLLVEKNASPKTCIENGFKEAFVTKVIRIIRNTNFKRMMPPVASIGQIDVQEGIAHLL